MDYLTQFDAIQRRPQLYGLDGSYGQFCAYLEGLDAGNDGRLFTGFREWLVTLLGEGDNLTWRGLVIHLARPDGPATGRGAIESADRDPAVVAKLFELVSDFFTHRARPADLVQIYDKYLTWKKAQSWHSDRP